MYQDNNIRIAIQRELAAKKYDLIHVETYYIMANIPQTEVPVLLADQTIEYLVYQHFAQTTKMYLLKPLLYLDAFKHKYWEKFYWEKAKRVVAMSGEDQQKMLELDPNLRVDVVPNGVDISFFSKKVYVKPRKYKRLLFVGNFNWLQNREAAEVLVLKVWPEIIKKMPSARLWIVGREPTPEIRALGENKNVFVSSDVEDIRTAYQGSDLLIAPIYGGGGTRYKILEAMASGLPVVSTQIGIEGLGAIHDKHALITNEEKKLAEYAIWVLKNKLPGKKMALRAKKLVADNYDWKPISAKLEKIYEETAGKS
jgi:glycosyltransferase involved in cell wall biosynthesis